MSFTWRPYLARAPPDSQFQIRTLPGIPPLIIGTVLLDLAIGLALHVGVSPSDVGETLRIHALKLEELGGEHYHGPIAEA